MEEVRPNNLEVGKDYYIEMVGSKSQTNIVNQEKL